MERTNDMTLYNKFLLAMAVHFFALLWCSHAAQTATVRVGVADISQSQISLFVAKDKGYYHQEGLDVELILMPGAIANQALIAGNVEYTTVPTAGLTAALQGAPLRVLFTTYYKAMFWLYSRPEIRELKDLVGKKVAVSSIGAAADSALREFLARHGLEAGRDIVVLSIGVGSTRFIALQNGTVDAAMLTTPWNFRAPEAGLRELVSFVKQDLIRLNGSIVVREALLQSDRAAVEKFIRATEKGFLSTLHNRADTAAILARNMKITEDLGAKIYDIARPAMTPDGILNDDLQKKAIAPMLERLGRKETPPLDKFFDFSLARKARGVLDATGWKPCAFAQA
jgi:ABC-type nitrate/sulfonate/bicarbonate transport system substrate-binding protein